MLTCSVCGNDYDKAFTVSFGGRDYVFDSFECAIHLLAPVCEHCGCKVIGHGVEARGVIYCCVHCAEHEGVKALKDRVD
jgi:Rieske Fe-S protein